MQFGKFKSTYLKCQEIAEAQNITVFEFIEQAVLEKIGRMELEESLKLECNIDWRTYFKYEEEKFGIYRDKEGGELPF